MFYSIEYVPGMVSLLLKELGLQVIDLEIGADPLSILVPNGVTIRVVPENGMLYYHDGSDDADNVVIVEDASVTEMLYRVSGAKDPKRRFHVEIDHIIKGRTYVGPIDDDAVAADIPWAVLDEHHRRMLVCLKGSFVPGFKQSDFEAYDVELAVHDDDPGRLHDMTQPLPDPSETFLFALKAASPKCARYLLSTGAVPDDTAYSVLVSHSLRRQGVAACAIELASIPTIKPTAREVQKIAMAFSRVDFAKFYQTLHSCMNV